MDKIAVDREVILSSRFVYDNDLISQLGAKIFVICERSIDKYKELSGGKINGRVE
jgi:hypothetical protein